MRRKQPRIQPRIQSRIQPRNTYKRAAVKRSRRAQTVLGDRQDLVYEILLQEPSAACGTRPAEFFNGWINKQKCAETAPATAAAGESFETVIEVHFSLHSQRSFFVFVSTNRKMAEPLESQRLRAAPTRLQQSIRLLPAENRRVPLQVQRHIQVR